MIKNIICVALVIGGICGVTFQTNASDCQNPTENEIEQWDIINKSRVKRGQDPLPPLKCSQVLSTTKNSSANQSRLKGQARDYKPAENSSSAVGVYIPMQPAINPSYGGVGQNLSHLGSAVMGPPPPTPYEQALYRVNRGTATSYDLGQLGIGGSPLPRLGPISSITVSSARPVAKQFQWCGCMPFGAGPGTPHNPGCPVAYPLPW
jgi:hypothetical protein